MPILLSESPTACNTQVQNPGTFLLRPVCQFVAAYFQNKLWIQGNRPSSTGIFRYQNRTNKRKSKRSPCCQCCKISTKVLLGRDSHITQLYWGGICKIHHVNKTRTFRAAMLDPARSIMGVVSSCFFFFPAVWRQRGKHWSFQTISYPDLLAFLMQTCILFGKSSMDLFGDKMKILMRELSSWTAYISHRELAFEIKVITCVSQ